MKYEYTVLWIQWKSADELTKWLQSYAEMGWRVLQVMEHIEDQSLSKGQGRLILERPAEVSEGSA